MDGHGSHTTANVIAHCMEHAIDLLILPPHTPHVLQPLDVSVFAPLKRALADAVSRVDSGRIQRVEWTEMYIRAREKAFTSASIASGWKATGLEPLSPIVVVDKVAATPTRRTLPPQPPGESPSLDLSLLHSSPPDGTELREANTVLNSELRKAGSVGSLIKRYAKRMTRAFEATQSELTTLRKRIAEQYELLHTRKARKRGKRVALKGRFVFSTEEVLQIAKEAEEGTAATKGRRRPHKRSVSIEIEESGDKVLDNISSGSKSDCNIVAKKKVT